MEEKKETKLDLKSIGKAASSVKALSDSLKDCQEQMKQMKEGNISAIEGILNIAVAAGGAYEAFGSLKDMAKTVQKSLAKNVDSKFIKKFEESVTESVKKIGEGLQKCPDAVNKFKESLKALPGKAASAFAGITGGVANLAKGIKTGFSTMKEHIKNFDFKEFMAKVKQLPSKVSSSFKSLVSSATTALKELPGKAKASVKQIPSILEGGFKGAGEKLSASASSIGAVAGKMMTVGLVGGVAIAAVAIIGFIAIFQKLMATNDEFKEKITNAWAQVKEAFQPAIDAFNTFKESIMGITKTDAFDSFVESFGDGIVGLIDIISEVVGIVADLLSGIFGFLTELWEEHGEGLIEKVQEVWEGIVEFLQTLGEGILEIFSAIFEVFKELWDKHGSSLMDAASSLWNSILDIVSVVWDAIKAVIGTVVDIVKAIWNNFGEEIMMVVTAVWEFIMGIAEGAMNFISGIIDVIVGIFTLNGDKILEGFGKMWEGVKGLFDAGLGFVTGIFSAIWSVINKIFDKVADWFGEKFRGAWKAIKNAFSNVGSFFSGIWDKIRSVFKSIGVKIGSAVGSAFKSTVNSVIRFAQGIINSFIGGLNKVVKIINKIPGVSISLIPKASLPKLADGGILEAGQMFIARERGPELVGSFGSRSGVMNNGQIVEAVSRGVFEAVKSAMSGGDGGNFTFHINNHLDGKEIGKQVIRYHNGIVKQTGMSPLHV